MVVGVNYRTAPVAVRERFWISETRRGEALVQLARADGIDEVAILATCKRTEFILWTRDPSAASGSVLSFLTREYGLRLSEWKHFYRKLEETALAHVFRVACGLDSMAVGEPEIAAQVKAAWDLAQQTGATARFLDAVLQRALSVSQTVRADTRLGSAAVSIPQAAVDLARQIFGSLKDRKVLLLGAGAMNEISAQYLIESGANDLRVIAHTPDRASALAQKIGAATAPFEQRVSQVQQADVVISSTSCPHLVLTRDEVAHIAGRRDGAPLLLVDIAVPRDIDPAVREIPGVFLYDIDGLEQARKIEDDNKAAAAEAEKIVVQEARLFHTRLLGEVLAPTIVALRGRLDEICRQELEAFRRDAGGISEEQFAALQTFATRITQRIAGSLARELKELPEKVEQERLTQAVQRLFHLEQLHAAVAGNQN